MCARTLLPAFGLSPNTAQSEPIAYGDGAQFSCVMSTGYWFAAVEGFGVPQLVEAGGLNSMTEPAVTSSFVPLLSLSKQCPAMRAAPFVANQGEPRADRVFAGLDLDHRCVRQFPNLDDEAVAMQKAKGFSPDL